MVWAEDWLWLDSIGIGVVTDTQWWNVIEGQGEIATLTAVSGRSRCTR